MKKAVIVLIALSVLLVPSVVLAAGPGDVEVPSDYASIQDAIDNAADGDVISVAAGTYNECLVLQDRDLHLIAIGDVTVAPAPGGCGTRAPTIWILNSVAVVDGFKVDGDYLGILARGDVDVIIKNNEVFDYSKNGITVIGLADNPASVQIRDNTVRGRGRLPYGDWAQNGIQLVDAEGIIEGNTVTGHWYTGGYWTAANILLFTSKVQVTANTLVNGQTGIYVYGTNNKVVRNTITASQYGPYPADWPPQDPPQTLYEYGSWGVLVYGDNNKVVANAIGPYDLGIENYLAGNKLINNRFVECVKDIDDYGTATKIHANAFTE